MQLLQTPYNKTKNSWDCLIPFDIMWDKLHKLCYDNTPIILFGQDKFTAKLMLSNEKEHRYNLIWKKVLTSGFLNANRMPLREHEDICVFYKKQPTYNPQKVKGKPNHSKGKPKDCTNNNYGKFDFVDNQEILGDMKHPTSVLEFSKPHPSVCVHPTQKPVELMEWLVKTYTNEGDTVLDFTAGSGSTGVACTLNQRNFIGIELDENYYNIMQKRITEISVNERNV